MQAARHFIITGFGLILIVGVNIIAINKGLIMAAECYWKRGLNLVNQKNLNMAVIIAIKLAFIVVTNNSLNSFTEFSLSKPFNQFTIAVVTKNLIIMIIWVTIHLKNIIISTVLKHSNPLF